METLIPEIARLLIDTLSPEQTLVSAATDGLDRLSGIDHFPLSLLAISRGGESLGLRIAAGTYLKNFIRRRDGVPIPTHHREFRNQLAQALIQAEPAVLRVLLEAFRVIILNDFVKDNSWPELVPELKSVIQSSNFICHNAGSQWNTLNALAALQTIVRPFQYFLNPKVLREPVPPQLELIAGEILVPLQATFCYFADKALSLQEHVEKDFEHILLLISKCMCFTVRSYMPSALLPHLPSFCAQLFRILGILNLDSAPVEDGWILRLKIAKRSLIFFNTIVTRHRKHVDKLLPSIINTAFKLAKQSVNLSKLDSLSERIVSLAFDVISHVLETGPGWRHVSPFFSSLLDDAIFPALTLNQRDVSEWEEDTDEYMRKNLPSELDEVSGWAEGLFTARKSAINLLGLIAISKGPPVVSSTSKRKKGDKAKRKDLERSIGELLVVPFLSKFAVPSDRGEASSKLLNDYYGVLMAYGGLQDFLRERNSEYMVALLQNRVLPLYSLSSCSPYLIATANWVLGQLASCLPQALNFEVYSSLMNALAMPNVGGINCYPVRASAAGAIADLLENEYIPPDWPPLLHVLVSWVNSEDENESSLLFQLLGTVVEAGGEKIAVHIPQIVSSISDAVSKHLLPIPETWPQVVERGFTALAEIVQSWEDSIPKEVKQHDSEEWHSGCAVIAKALSNLLQQAWLTNVRPLDGAVSCKLPPSSCLDDTSSLLGFVMRSVTAMDEAIELKVPELLAVWADLIADWHAWEEMDDMAIFSSIKEAINLHKRCDLTNFFTRRMACQGLSSGSSGSVIEAISTFVSEAIAAYPSALWRACSCMHILLHIPTFSFDVDTVKQLMAVKFALVAFSRFKDIHDKPLGLWKPLLLVISASFMCYPEAVVEMLEKEVDNGFIMWARGLSYISTGSSDPGLSSESEIKLAVMTLVKVLERLLRSPQWSRSEVTQGCFVSLMEACIHLTEVQREEDETEDVDDEDSDEEIDIDDNGNVDNEEESMDDEHEETEEEFLERYAEAANELENEIVEEGDLEDQVQELELGALDEVDVDKAVLLLLQRYHQVLVSGQALPPTVIEGIMKMYPEYGSLFQASC